MYLYKVGTSDIDYSAVKELYNLKSFERRNGNDYNDIIDALKSCKKLEYFAVSGQKINDMSRISEISDNLKELNFTNCSIKKISGLENKLNLGKIVLTINGITKIENLGNLKNLKTLVLDSNDIEDITPLSENTSLMSLSLKGNKRINADRNSYTEEGQQALNKIGEILDKGGTIYLDADKLRLFTNYKKLVLSSQNLTTLECLEGLTQLTYLDLSYNNLTLDDAKSQEILGSMTNLRDLKIAFNPLTNITVINNLKNLKTLSFIGTHVNLVEIEDIISNLSSLMVSSETLKTIVNCDANKITQLNVNDSGLTEIPDLSRFIRLKQINFSGNSNVSNFENISKLTSIEVLYLKSNKLHGRMIDFSNLINLRTLDLSGNTLWSEDLENLKALKNNSTLSINLSNNSIIDATALLELSPGTKINLTGNINLSQDSKDKLKEHFGNNVTF